MRQNNSPKINKHAKKKPPYLGQTFKTLKFAFKVVVVRQTIFLTA